MLKLIVSILFGFSVVFDTAPIYSCEYWRVENTMMPLTMQLGHCPDRSPYRVVLALRDESQHEGSRKQIWAIGLQPEPLRLFLDSPFGKWGGWK